MFAVGLDVQSTYTPFYSGTKHLRATPMVGQSAMTTPSNSKYGKQRNNNQPGNLAQRHLTFDSPNDGKWLNVTSFIQQMAEHWTC